MNYKIHKYILVKYFKWLIETSDWINNMQLFYLLFHFMDVFRKKDAGKWTDLVCMYLFVSTGKRAFPFNLGSCHCKCFREGMGGTSCWPPPAHSRFGKSNKNSLLLCTLFTALLSVASHGVGTSWLVDKGQIEWSARRDFCEEVPLIELVPRVV